MDSDVSYIADCMAGHRLGPVRRRAVRPRRRADADGRRARAGVDARCSTSSSSARGDGQPPFTNADYHGYVDGRHGSTACARSWQSRGIVLPEGDRRTTRRVTATVGALGNRKNELFNELLSSEGIAPYPGSVRLLDQLTARARRWPSCRRRATPGGAARRRPDPPVRRRRRRRRRRRTSTSPASRRPTRSSPPPASSACRRSAPSWSRTPVRRRRRPGRAVRARRRRRPRRRRSRRCSTTAPTSSSTTSPSWWSWS